MHLVYPKVYSILRRTVAEGVPLPELPFQQGVLMSRGEPLCTLVNEIIGMPLALTVFPQVYDFAGDAVLELVEPGLYKKGWRTSNGTR
jgi:hypothetical protein